MRFRASRSHWSNPRPGGAATRSPITSTSTAARACITSPSAPTTSFATVAALRRRGLRTLDVPPTYYVAARARLDGLDLPWTALERLGVLVDRDEHGHLFQAFTEPIGDRPTVCLELIQRVGATGFGHENIRALYDAVLREQESAPTP